MYILLLSSRQQKDDKDLMPCLVKTWHLLNSPLDLTQRLYPSVSAIALSIVWIEPHTEGPVGLIKTYTDIGSQWTDLS